MGSGLPASLLLLLVGGNWLLFPHHATAQDTTEDTAAEDPVDDALADEVPVDEDPVAKDPVAKDPVAEDPADLEEFEDVEDDRAEILANKGIRGKVENFKDSVYSTKICEQFDKFFHNKFGDQVDYDACELLYSKPKFAEVFRDFLREYRKKYPDAKEQKKRYANFAANLLFIMVENQRNKGYEVGVNEFADLSPEEFSSTHTGLTLGGTPGGHRRRRTSLGGSSGGHRRRRHPYSFDWNKRGAVNKPVPNQGNCNSCWAFATAGAIEGHWKIKTGKLVVLSKRQIMDCAGLGCNFGNLQVPITGLIKYRASICTESSRRYTTRPYNGVTRNCKPKCSTAIPAGNVIGYQAVKPNDELHLIDALVHKGPVALGIDGLGRAFQFYRSGVLAPPCSNTPNHAVLLIGYGRSGGRKYWLIKNSWGHTWGEKGFFRLKKEHSGRGECAVKTMPTYPRIRGARLLLDHDMDEEIDGEVEGALWGNSSNASSSIAAGEMLQKHSLPQVAAATLNSPPGASRFGLAACSLLAGLGALGAFGWRLIYRSGSRRWLLLGTSAE